MKKLFVDIIVFLSGVVSFFYVLNPTGGIIELIPDNFPILGNIDEATATAVFLGSLHYFGLEGGRIVKALQFLSGRKIKELPEKTDSTDGDENRESMKDSQGR